MADDHPSADEIAALFASYSEAWDANDPERIAGHWDRTQPPFYKAEEIPHFITDWDGLTAYWKHNEGFHDAVWLRFREPQVKPLTPNLAMVAVRMRWDIQFARGTQTMDGAAFAHAGRAMGGDNHVLTVVRRVDGVWRLTAWSETPDAPITYMTQLYLKDVTPGFPPPAS